MELRFAPRGIIEIYDAHILKGAWCNFSGEASQYNAEGDRNFNILIEDRDLTQEEVDNFLDIYPEAFVDEAPDGPVVKYNNDEIATASDLLKALGYNVKIRTPRVEDQDPFEYLKIKVKFNDYGPIAKLIVNRRQVNLNENTIGSLDRIAIANCDLAIRPYDWNSAMGSGRTAYLEKIYVTQEIDRLSEKYSETEYPHE